MAGVLTDVEQSSSTGYLFSSGLSVLFHLGIIGLVVLTFIDKRPHIVAPAAIMLSFAEQPQVSQPKEALPLGVNQQQKAAHSTPQLTRQAEKVEAILPADKGEIFQPKPREHAKATPKPKDRQLRNTLQQQAAPGNATLTSRAAPQPMRQAATKTAAPIQSDAKPSQQAQLSWEGLVKGQLNRVKRYPADAKRRGREGTVDIRFLVNSNGEIIASEVVGSSGTLALDRESLAMLKRAEPLPKPPPELLSGGSRRVNMPIRFDLSQAN